MHWFGAHSEIALGFADEVWWSRLTQPRLHSWSEAQSLRLVEQSLPPEDAERKALAGYGVYLPAAHQMLLRFVAGRPVSAVTCAFLHWLGATCARQGKRALVLIWDNASWHTSQAVRQWIRAYNRRIKQEGGCRLLVCYLPKRSPWLNPIEPKWVHGKRAVAEPERILSVAELMQRLCAFYQCQLLEPLAQSVC